MPNAIPQQTPLVLIAAGGTGGHVFPALAVALALRNNNVGVRWVGTQSGIEAKIVAEHGLPMTFIRVVGWRGKNMLYRIKAPFLLLAAVYKIWRLMRKKHIGCVLCMGGYVSAAAGLAAFLARKPLLLQEQNAVAGSTNKLLAPLSTHIFTAFPSVFKRYQKTHYVGNPLREDVLGVAAPEQRLDHSATTLRILVLGGSLGAQVLNQLLPEVIAKLQSVSQMTRRIEVLHQAGSKGVAAVSQRYEEAGVQATVYAFIDDMAQAYAHADIVVARAGALTVSEIAAVGVASILVPYPHAIDDHQSANAQWLVEAGAATSIAQADLSVERLLAVLQLYCKREDQLLVKAKCARAVGQREATDRIARVCEEYACA